MKTSSLIGLDMYPLVSVVIPAYNAEKYVVQTLRSVFDQSYKNIEVIVVNDGSTDQTLNILSDIQKQDARLKVISQSNQGISAARNSAIANASGDFITFIDSDDIWDLTFVTKMVERQQQTQGDVIYTGNIDSSSKGDHIRESDFRQQENLAGYLTQKSLLHIGCLFIRKQFLDENQLRFDTALKTGEDIVFICTLFCLTDAFSVPEYLYYYTHRDNSVMHRPWSKQDYLNDLTAWQQLEKIIKSCYQKNDRLELINLIEAKVVYYKLRLLWLLLLAGRNKDLIALLNEGFLTYSEKNLYSIPKKYAGIRRKIIESRNPLLWKITKLIHRRKINLT